MAEWYDTPPPPRRLSTSEAYAQRLRGDREGMQRAVTTSLPRLPLTPTPDPPLRPGGRNPREETIWQGHPHWRGLLGRYMRAFLGLAVVLAIAGFASTQTPQVPAWAVVAFGLIALVGIITAGRLVQRTTHYTITNRRIIKRWGIVVTRQEEARLRSVSNIHISQRLSQRLLGIGTLNFDTSGEADGRRRAGTEGRGDFTVFWGVRRPFSVRNELSLHDDWHDEF